MEESLKKTSLPWEKIAYMWKNYFTVPSRISPQEVEKYREWLKMINRNKKPLKGLVLGATPELRKAFMDFNYNLHSIDINLDMFLAMNELLAKKDPNEVLIKSNWMNNPLAGGYFDVIVGDAIMPNVPWNKRRNLLLEIRRLLKPKGIFLTRAFYVPDDKRFSGIGEILEHFTKKEPTVQTALETVLEIQILTYDPKDHLGSMAKVKKALEDFHRKRGIKFENKNMQKVHDIVWNVWCKNFVEKDWVYAYRKEEEEHYGRYFKIKQFFEAKDHDYGGITPMYFLRK